MLFSPSATTSPPPLYLCTPSYAVSLHTVFLFLCLSRKIIGVPGEDPGVRMCSTDDKNCVYTLWEISWCKNREKYSAYFSFQISLFQFFFNIENLLFFKHLEAGYPILPLKIVDKRSGYENSLFYSNKAIKSNHLKWLNERFICKILENRRTF